MVNTMKAACYKQLGGPEVLEILDLEIPEPGPGEVRVKVNVSGVNPSDWKARRNGVYILKKIRRIKLSK